MRAPRSSPPPWWRLKNSWPQGLGVFIHVMLLFLFLSQFTAGAFAKEAGPKCQVFDKKPEECIPYVNNRVYLPPDVTQEQIASAMEADLVTASNLQSQMCRKSWTAFICARNLPKCSYGDDAKAVMLQHPICRSFCEEVVQNCRAEFTLGSKEDLLPNCNDTVNGLPTFPPDSEPYRVIIAPNTTILNKCFYPGVKDDDDDNLPSSKCPKHYVDLGDEYDETKYVSRCQRKCPLSIYSDPEYLALSITQIVEGYLGFVMLLLVLIPFIINFSETNTFPSIIPLYIYISCGLMALGFMWPSFFDGFHNVTCEKNFRPANVTYFPCGVQGLLLYWGTSTLAMWWFNVCLHLLIGSFTSIGYSTKGLRRMYYFLGWFVPTIGLIIGWSSTRIGASATSVNCFIDWDAGDGWWANGIFYLELTIIVSIGFLILHIAIIRLLFTYGLAGVHKQGRLLIFAYSFLYIFMFLMIYWWVIEAKRGHYEHAKDRWFDCLIEGFKAEEKAGHQIYYNEDYGCMLADRNPFGMIYTQTLIISSVPFFVALVFGHSWYTWNMWGTIVCSFLCVTIQSLANPSVLFTASTPSPLTSPRPRRKGGKQSNVWLGSGSDIEMEGVGSNVKFTALGSDDEEEWAGDQSEYAVEEGEIAGKGRKRASAGALDSSGEGDVSDDSENEATTDYTSDEEDSDKDE